MVKDYYKVMELSNEAAADEVKKAYRRLGLCHCTGPPAAGLLAQEFGEHFFLSRTGRVVQFP